MKIGYFIPDFPSQTHAFFWNELKAVGDQTGTPVAIVSTSRPEDDKCAHAFATEARVRTTYLLASGELARGVLCAVVRPVAAMRGLREAMGLKGMSLPARLGAWVAGMRLVAWARSHGVDHLHVHSAANTALVSMVSCVAGGPSYSIVLHGDPEVYGSHHDRKLARAACLIPVTNPLAARVRAEGWIDASKIHVITMGVDTERFTAEGERDTDPPLILTVARLNKNKGVQFALDALARLRDEGVRFRFVVLGEGPYRGALADRVVELGLEDSVELPGTASQDEVLRLLRRSSIFALTSIGKGEAAPVSVMEAMSTGTPVVVSRIGGTPDMINHGVDGYLVDQEDVDGIADAFRMLLTSASRRAEIGERARDRAVRAFDYRVLAAQVVSVIASHTGKGS